MVHIKWQRMLVSVALLVSTVVPVGAALAAPAITPAGSGDFSSCLQAAREGLGTILPGSSSRDQVNLCLLSGAADGGSIAFSGVANTLSWRDAGASISVVSFGGWRDVGAGSR